MAGYRRPEDEYQSEQSVLDNPAPVTLTRMPGPPDLPQTPIAARNEQGPGPMPAQQTAPAGLGGGFRAADRFKMAAKAGGGKHIAQTEETGMMAGVPEAVGGRKDTQDLLPMATPVGKDQVAKAERILQDYKAGKASVERRIIHCQQMWKLIDPAQKYGDDTGSQYRNSHSSSAWLWNCVVAKHADAIDSYPEPVILPRMADDRQEAEALSDIIPVVLQRNGFDEVYSDCMWQKYQEGTGAYSVMWDKTLENGRGDIAIRQVNLLNLFWEPGVKDIQDSRNVFLVTLEDKDVLEQQYPELRGKTGGMTLNVAHYAYDDNVKTDDKAVVVDWYYKKNNGQRDVLHYVKFVNGTVLYATENDTAPGEPDPMTGMQKASPAEVGLYEDGMYPFVLDRLYPVEGSPTGYGYITIAEETQHDIDVLKKALIKAAMVSSVPRYFTRQDGCINEAEFADLNAPLVHTDGNLGEDAIRPIDRPGMDGNAINMLQQLIDEMKFITGNTDVNNGSVPTGVTAASAIAALKEDSGRSSKDSNKATYRSYARIVTMVIERIRQFYDMPRSFRIIGDRGEQLFRYFDNSGIVAQSQGRSFGADMGYRLPVFDVEVRAQRETAYTKMAQNELALQFYGQGFFNPQQADQALNALDMMQFNGKEDVVRKIEQNSITQQVLVNVLQIGMGLAEQYDPAAAQQLAGLVEQLQQRGVLGGQPMAQTMQDEAAAKEQAQQSQSQLHGDETTGTRKMTNQEETTVQRTTNATRPQ